MKTPAGKPRGIVTGAASGIGRAVVGRLLSEGVDVLAVDINAAALAVLPADNCRTMALDLADAGARAELLAEAQGASYLVNSHGIIVIRPIFEVSLEEWRRVQTINAESVFFLCQKLGPVLAEGGAIVNLSSSSAKLASTIEVASYAASKTTITSITRSFAYALAPRRVRVNAICPGIIDTPMQDAVLAGVSKVRGSDIETLQHARAGTVPLGRVGTPDDCAALIWFLLSNEGAYMTGQSINITGGLVTW